MLTRKRIISLIITVLILLISAFVFRTFKTKKKSTVSKAPQTKELRQIETAHYPLTSTKNLIEIDGQWITWC